MRARYDDVSYQVAGSGTPVVLLHGFTQDSRVWRDQLADLSGEFRVVAWDAPGTGASADPPESWAIEDWSDALARLLDALDIERAHIVGLSWGGLLAQVFYRDAGERVLSLVLADTYAGWAGSLSPSVAEERLKACERDSLLPTYEFVARYLPGMLSPTVDPVSRLYLGEIMAETHPAGFRLMAKALAIADTRALLPTITVPTLLLWGDQDVRAPLSVGEAMHASIPASRLVVLEGAGHVSNIERPRAFTASVREFIRPLAVES